MFLTGAFSLNLVVRAQASNTGGDAADIGISLKDLSLTDPE